MQAFQHNLHETRREMQKKHLHFLLQVFLNRNQSDYLRPYFLLSCTTLQSTDISLQNTSNCRFLTLFLISNDMFYSGYFLKLRHCPYLQVLLLFYQGLILYCLQYLLFLLPQLLSNIVL